MINRFTNIEDYPQGFMLHLKHTKKNEVHIDIIPYEDGLNYFKKLIDCDTIDVVMRRFNGKPYHLIIDDEGLINGKPFTLSSKCRKEVIVGNVLICKSDHYESLLGLTIEECIELSTFLINKGNYTF